MPNAPIPPVPTQAPLTDKNGMVSNPWMAFFTELLNRAGGPQAQTNVQLQASINAFALAGAQTIKGNNTGTNGNAMDLTPSQVAAMLPVFVALAKGLVPASGGGTLNFLRADGRWKPFSSSPPTVQRFLAGAGTYHPTSANLLYVKMTISGGGGGGGGYSTNGGNGGDTTFGTGSYLVTARGGVGGTQTEPSLGGLITFGAALGVIHALQGGSSGGGATNSGSAFISGGMGGANPLGGQGGGQYGISATPSLSNAIDNTGGGGGGGSFGASTAVGAGGGAGAYGQFIISGAALQAIITSGAPYSIGAQGSPGNNAGNGALGVITLEEFSQ